MNMVVIFMGIGWDGFADGVWSVGEGGLVKVCIFYDKKMPICFNYFLSAVSATDQGITRVVAVVDVVVLAELKIERWWCNQYKNVRFYFFQ